MTWRLNNSKASVRLKTKGALGKHCTPLDKVFSPQKYGLTILNSLYIVDMNIQINKCWMPEIRILSAIVESYGEVRVGG